ncbi:MAG: type III-B CRISPR module RAMP protein Cmr4 [Candidatus Omnitrophica bacterium]|nr:type III-B CRISPR module RAMP protein Cmr4 [Candidatus Omnitrophota bacterium]
MFKEKLILTFYAQTPVHMGSGTSVSYVDNPIQREKHTDFPILAGSGIKGVIRDLAKRKWQDKNKVDVIFGPEDGAEEYASCISFTDAKILLYPVRSVKGVFAYITCPYVLKRFKNELNSVEEGSFLNCEISDVSGDDKILICSNSDLKIEDNKVALEEFVFTVDDKNIDELASKLCEFLPNEIRDKNDESFKKHFAIVSDNVFRDFTRYAVEIRTRIRINQTTGTVTEGALFTVELVPAESIFYGFLFITDPKFGIDEKIYTKLKEKKNKNPWEDALNDEKIKEEITKKKEIEERIKKAYEGDYFSSEEIHKEFKELLKNDIIQLGGDETLGMGLMKVKIFENQRG